MGHTVNAKLFPLSRMWAPEGKDWVLFLFRFAPIPYVARTGLRVLGVPVARTQRLCYPPQNHQPREPKQRHCLGSKTRQPRPVYLGDALRTVQDATLSPTTATTCSPTPCSQTPPHQPTLCWQGQNQWQLLRSTAPLPPIPFFPLGQQLLYKARFHYQDGKSPALLSKGWPTKRQCSSVERARRRGRAPLCHVLAEEPRASA